MRPASPCCSLEMRQDEQDGQRKPPEQSARRHRVSHHPEITAFSSPMTRLTHRSPSDVDSVSGVPPIRLALLKQGAESCNRSLRPYYPTGLPGTGDVEMSPRDKFRGADRTGAGGNPASGRLERVERFTHGELVRLPRGSRDGSESGPSGTVSRKRQRPLKALVGSGRRQRPISLAGYRSMYSGTSLGRSERDELRPSKSPFGILGD